MELVMAYPASIGGNVTWTGAGDTVPVPDGVVFAYNGVTFGPYVRTKVMEEPVQSGDNRMVKCSKLTIHASGWITQDDAGADFEVNAATVVNGGAGYLVNDVVTFQGGSFLVQAAIVVTQVDGGGAITGFSFLLPGGNRGNYQVRPSNNVSVAGGAGLGATFSLKWDVLNYNTLDALMLSIRRKLQVNGKHLQYVNEGYGADLNINDPAAGAVGIRDVQFGPKPGAFNWWTLGGAPTGCFGAGFEWTVTTWIAECSQFNIAPGVFLEVSFTVDYSTDEAGIVTITYHGNAQIPMSLRSDNTLDRNIDSEIQRIIRGAPTGFIRRMSRQLSADRANCSFMITDTQLEVPYPNGVVHIDMRQRIHQHKATFLCPIWNCTISGTVRISPTAVRSLAWRVFYNLAMSRIAFTQNHAAVVAQQLNPQPLQGMHARFWKPSIFVMGTNMEEDFFKNESRFVIDYKILGAPFDIIARVSGLWQPVVNNGIANTDVFTAQSWSASLANNAQAFRGYLGANFPNANEVVIDVCNGPFTSQNQIGQVSANFNRRDQTVSSGPSESDLEQIEPGNLQYASTSVGADIDERYPVESSWLAWECVPELITEHNQVRHKPLAGTITTDTPEIDPFGEVDDVADDVSLPSAGWSSTVSDKTQQVASPSLTIRLVGYGVRIGRRVNAPKLISYGDQPAVLKRESIAEKKLASSVDFVMYRIDWVLEYIIPGAPDSLPLPANPFLGAEGEPGE
jgi:hypothetical protein